MTLYSHAESMPKRGSGQCVWCRRRFRRAFRVFSRPAARLGPLVDASTNLGGGEACWGSVSCCEWNRKGMVSTPPMVVGCLKHRADDPSFDASVARAHWASTLRSGTVRAAVGSLLTLLSVVERVDGVRCAGSRRLAGAEICRPRPYHGSNRWVTGRRASNRGYLRAY